MIGVVTVVCAKVGVKIALHCRILVPGLHNPDLIAAGTFPFLFVLHPNLPGTYRGLYGGIFYTLTAFAERGWPHNISTTRGVHIQRNLDLNKLPSTTTVSSL